jgi:PIN domain nuclease of toxin-antitoxin system
MLFLDTHILVWLYQKDLEQFSEAGISRLEHDLLIISPAVLLELEYLYENGDITVQGQEIVDYLARTIELETDAVSFLPIAEQAARLQWTSDPFDRLLTAQAMFHAADFLTRDRTILANYPKAVW